MKTWTTEEELAYLRGKSSSLEARLRDALYRAAELRVALADLTELTATPASYSEGALAEAWERASHVLESG